MNNLDLAVIKARIADRCDPDYVVDVLGLTTEQILDRFEDVLLEKIHEWSEVEDPD